MRVASVDGMARLIVTTDGGASIAQAVGPSRATSACACSAIAEDAGGSVTMRSEVGAGATITAEVPTA